MLKRYIKPDLSALTPGQLKFILNIYPPYLGAGIRVDHISNDWKSISVSMKLRWYNKNIVGTHFGGSLYSMVDPHLMLMLLNLMGREYIVWDKSASIKFIKPGKGKVRAEFQISDEILNEIHSDTEKHTKAIPTFDVDVTDEEGEIVARISKHVYVRKKRAKYDGGQ